MNKVSTANKRALGLIALCVVATVSVLIFRPVWLEFAAEQIATPVERLLFDLRARQKPVSNWADVERGFEALPRATWEEVASSPYAASFGSYSNRGACPVPKAFVRVDRVQRFRYIFRGWRLVDFVSPDTRRRLFLWPQYIALDKCLLLKLHLLFDCLEKKNLHLQAVHIGNAFRTPRHNQELLGVTPKAARSSQHMCGTAIDLLLDDVNGDSSVNMDDRRPLEDCLGRIDRDPRLKTLRGGLSAYPEPYLLHFDCRGTPATW